MYIFSDVSILSELARNIKRVSIVVTFDMKSTYICTYIEMCTYKILYMFSFDYFLYKYSSKHRHT